MKRSTLTPQPPSPFSEKGRGGKPKVTVQINGETIQDEAGASVAAAILNSGQTGFRRAVGGGFRGPVCGMGVCYECQVRVNGVAHIRSCMTQCEEGMEVDTDA